MRDVESQAVLVLRIKGRGPTYPEEHTGENRFAKLEKINLLHDTQQLFSKALEEKSERACEGVYGYTGKIRFHYRFLSVLYRSGSGTLPHPT